MKQAFRTTIGIIALVTVLTPLLSTPSMISPSGVSLIATEIQGSSGNEIFVRTKLDFAHPEIMKTFPQQIGEWHSISYNWSRFEEILGADIMLSRAYRHPSFSNPVFFLIIQSTNISSFHPPTVCYAALGYEIAEEGVELVPIEDASWAKGYWRSEQEGLIFKGEMNTKKLVVIKRTDGEITERRVVLYYYVKDERMSVPQEITMIRLSALAPLNGSYQDTVESLKKLAADTFQEMFEVKPQEKMFAEILVIEHGTPGFLVIAMLVSAPIIFMLLPFVRIRVMRK
jgi:hypothetical protein